MCRVGRFVELIGQRGCNRIAGFEELRLRRGARHHRGGGDVFGVRQVAALDEGREAIGEFPAGAQADEEAAEKKDATVVETVNIVGTRRVNASATDTVVPVDFIPMSKSAEQGGQFDLAQSLQYISPKFGGLSVQAGFVPEGNVAGAKNNVSLGVSYGVDKLSAAVAYESKRVDGGEDFMSVSAGYDFGFAKFALGYADGGKNAKGLSTGVTVPVGAGITVGGQYARNSDTKGSAYELFVNKEVLKNTYAYFEAGKANAKTGVDGTGYALGLILVF